MRHRKQSKRFSRSPDARKALIRGLVLSLVEHERIRTTLTKAKELRRHMEKAVTMGRKADLNTIRVLLSRYPDKNTVSKIVNDLSVRFKERPGGYTRILKLGTRSGDGAPMAFIEFVDFDPKNPRKKEIKVHVKTKDGNRKQVIKELSLEEREQYRKVQGTKARLEKKKRLRQIQNQSRKINRV